MKNPLRSWSLKFAQWLNPPRRRTYYAGAAGNRLTMDWDTFLNSPDREIRIDGPTLRGRSRQLFRDNAHIAGFVQQLKNDVIGYEQDGIRLQARIKTPRGKISDELKRANLAIEEAFWCWAEPENCSADGQNSWGDLQRLALGTWIVDGECFIRRLRGFNNKYGYALQMLDADQFDHGYNVAAESGRAEIRMSVEIDRYGRPVAYHPFKHHPNDDAFRRGDRTRVRIPADEIIHLYTQLRPGQTRGLPALTPILIAMKMLDGYTEAEITQARIAASAGGFLTSTGEDAAMYTQGMEPDDLSSLATEGSRMVIDLEPGVVRALPPGMQYQNSDPSHPNGNFAEFQKAILRTVARGLGVSYNSFGNDLESVNYSSIRAGMLAERDTFRLMARWLTMRLHRPVYRDFLSMGSLYNVVSLPYPDVDKCTTCNWLYRGWPWVDPLNDAQAFEILRKNGLTNRTIALGEMGRDRDEVWPVLKEEEDEAEAIGIDVSGTQPSQPQQSEDDDDDSQPADTSADDDSDDDDVASGDGSGGNPSNGNGKSRRQHGRPYPHRLVVGGSR
jgi:lambda family phage portal protein